MEPGTASRAQVLDFKYLSWLGHCVATKFGVVLIGKFDVV